MSYQIDTGVASYMHRHLCTFVAPRFIFSARIGASGADMEVQGHGRQTKWGC
jgi:hypothetical protein